MKVVENAEYYMGQLNTAEHNHSCCELFYLKKGRILLNIEGKEYMPKENSVHILSPMEKHSVTCLSEEYERYIIFMNLDNFEVYCTNPTLIKILKNRPVEFQHVFHSKGLDYEAIFKYCADEHRLYKDCQFTNLRMANLVVELLIMLYRTEPERFIFRHDNLRLVEIQKYIEDNYNNHIKISELADKFYINQYYLSHSFKDFTGYSPKQYLSKIRLIQVRKLLVSENTKIAEIAERTGFETINDLSRQFKNEFGISPTDFRKNQTELSYH